MSESNLQVPNNKTIYCNSLVATQGVTSGTNNKITSYSGQLLGVLSSASPFSLFTIPMASTGHALYVIDLEIEILCVAGTNNTGFISQKVVIQDGSVGGVPILATPKIGGYSFLNNIYLSGQAGSGATVSIPSNSITVQGIDNVAGNTDNICWKATVLTSLGP